MWFVLIFLVLQPIWWRWIVFYSIFSCGSTDAIRFLKHLLRNVLCRC